MPYALVDYHDLTKPDHLAAWVATGLDYGPGAPRKLHLHIGNVIFHFDDESTGWAAIDRLISDLKEARLSKGVERSAAKASAR